MNKLIIACIVANLLFAGCVFPGESELFVKTSALSKAMHGEQTEIMVRVKGEIALSNANERISVGLEGITTKKDFVLAIADVYSDVFLKSEGGRGLAEPKDVRRSISFSVEERKQDVPLLRMEATFPAVLMLKGARFDVGKSSAPIIVLEYDPSDGALNMSTNLLSNVFGVEYFSAIIGASKMLEGLKLVEKNSPAELLKAHVAFLPFVMWRERVPLGL